MNAFSITRQVKERWCILVEIALGFVFMISSSIINCCLRNYNPSDLKEEGYSNPRLFLIIPFINALVCFVIVYLQFNVKKRKMGCICGMVWGVMSCVLSIVFAIVSYDSLDYYYYDKMMAYFIVIACITWLILPLSIIILCCNRSSKRALPITTVPSSKV